MLVPMQRYASIRARNSSGRSAGSARRRKVRFGSALDTTRRARDLLAGREPHAGRGAAAGHDPIDLGVRADLAAGLPGSLRHQLGDAAHAAADEPPLPHPAVGSLARVVVQQHERGPRRRRAGHRIVDRVPPERREHVRRREILRQVLGRPTSRTGRRGRRASGAGGTPAFPIEPPPAGRGRCASRGRARSSRTRGPRRAPAGRDPLRSARARPRPTARTASSPRRWPPCRRRAGTGRRRGAMLSVGPAGSTTTPRRTSRMSRQIDSRSIDKT